MPGPAKPFLPTEPFLGNSLWVGPFAFDRQDATGDCQFEIFRARARYLGGQQKLVLQLVKIDCGLLPSDTNAVE